MLSVIKVLVTPDLNDVNLSFSVEDNGLLDFILKWLPPLFVWVF
jgi:hypothetical protein